MFVRAQILLPVAMVALIISCGDGRDKKPKLDLVGKTKCPAQKAMAPERREASQPDEVHEKSFVVDLIQDLVFRNERDGWTLTTESAHVTVDKLRRGGLDLVFSALSSTPGNRAYEELERRFRLMEELVEPTDGAVRLVRDLDEAKAARRDGALPMMLLVEGADAFEGRIAQLEKWRRRGLAALGIVGGRMNAFADTAVAPRKNSGLTDHGVELVEGCEALGILVDLTHASAETFWDVLSRPKSRVVVTHSAARALRDHPRNLDDIQILGLHRRQGVMGLLFNPDFLTQGQGASIEDVIAHIMHFKRLGVVDALALGTDFDGVIPPRGLEDASRLPRLTERLTQRGLSSEEIAGLLGENALRVLEQAENLKEGQGSSAGQTLRPVAVRCDGAIGEISGAAHHACDGHVFTGTLVLKPLGQLKVRIRDMSLSPASLEVFGAPGVPWQLEGQNLEGRILFHRTVALDARGRAEISLPSNRNLTRIFLSPSRQARLGEVVVWGR